VGSAPVGFQSSGYYLDGWPSATIMVYNQSLRSTQPSIPMAQVNQVPACLDGLKAGHICLC